MRWNVEYTDEFGEWWSNLDEGEQDAVDVAVGVLEERGPQLAFPFTSSIATSRHRHMRELRVQHKGRPYRVLYAFDPRRVAILLIGGKKTGDDRWYEKAVPVADKLYDEHLREIAEEGAGNG
jgi:hypothetical protein